MTKKVIVIATVVIALAAFGGAALFYKSAMPEKETATELAMPEVAVDMSGLVREHSPIIGNENAPVTVVEFFDPSCESCRAAYPFVKESLAKHGDDVRLVLRYAAFHEDSDKAVGILEAARLQDKFVPVLEALLQHQPEWAIHGAPNIDKAWELAGAAGLDVAKAKKDAQSPAVAEVLRQDGEDIATFQVRGTPSFFVNGVRLTQLGPQPFEDAVSAALAEVK